MGFLIIFFQKSPFTENYFLIAAINLTTRGPLYTYLVEVSVDAVFYNFLWRQKDSGIFFGQVIFFSNFV